MFIIELAVLDETRQHIEFVAKKYRIDIDFCDARLFP